MQEIAEGWSDITNDLKMYNPIFQKKKHTQQLYIRLISTMKTKHTSILIIKGRSSAGYFPSRT